MTNNNFDKKLLVENCQKIDIKDLLKQAKEHLKKELLSLGINAQGIPTTVTTSITGNGGIRLWFICPICKERKRILYKNLMQSIGCRTCLKLAYLSSVTRNFSCKP